ncbi:MAG: S1 RNA-binding domain-containing protein [Patescibacteria group bacterium]
MSDIQDQNNDFSKLLEKDDINIPQVGDVIKGRVVSASKAEVKLDVNGVLMGVVRGPELYDEAEEFSNLKIGDEIEAAVIEEENEKGELELSFRQVGQEKAWETLRQAGKDKTIVKVRVIDANKGGLLVRYCQINGFLPVSQLAPENYPRISGGDKSKILEKLKSFVGQDLEVNVMNLSIEEDKVIFSEKDVWNKKQKPALDKYKPGQVVDGKITAITNFGVFISFDENIEGLIHISELAWQRIDSPNELYRVGDKVKAEIVSIDGAKIFLSAKRLLQDPWREASKKYKAGQVVKGVILKVNPFGLFVKLDEEIHGLAHISQLNLEPKAKITELFQAGQEIDFEIVNISIADHRLGLKLAGSGIPQKETSTEQLAESEDESPEEEKKEKKKSASKAKK